MFRETVETRETRERENVRQENKNQFSLDLPAFFCTLLFLSFTDNLLFIFFT